MSALRLTSILSITCSTQAQQSLPDNLLPHGPKSCAETDFEKTPLPIICHFLLSSLFETTRRGIVRPEASLLEHLMAMFSSATYPADCGLFLPHTGFMSTPLLITVLPHVLNTVGARGFETDRLSTFRSSCCIWDKLFQFRPLRRDGGPTWMSSISSRARIHIVYCYFSSKAFGKGTADSADGSVLPRLSSWRSLSFVFFTCQGEGRVWDDHQRAAADQQHEQAGGAAEIHHLRHSRYCCDRGIDRSVLHLDVLILPQLVLGQAACCVPWVAQR